LAVAIDVISNSLTVGARLAFQAYSIAIDARRTSISGFDGTTRDTALVEGEAYSTADINAASHAVSSVAAIAANASETAGVIIAYVGNATVAAVAAVSTGPSGGTTGRYSREIKVNNPISVRLVNTPSVPISAVAPSPPMAPIARDPITRRNRVP
jgi:hypothetical protein